MSTKKSKKAVAKNKFNTAINTAKNVTKKANGFALNTTEEVVSETLTAVSQWQEVANKVLKGGFKLAASQQDIIFDTLDTFKAQFLQGRKKFHKLFA